jgi:hypothetical protein
MTLHTLRRYLAELACGHLQVAHLAEPPLDLGLGVDELAMSVQDGRRLETAVSREPLV